MAWTAPKTWTAAVVTASEFNTHIRDNMSHLKTPFDSTGKLTALSSSYVASLAGTNLTGIALVGAGNTYTAGEQNFNSGTTRFRVPVGADLYAGAKTAGSIWVEGDYLHYVDAGASEWRYLGTSVSTPVGALTGSVWIDTSTAFLHYVDADGDERYVRFYGVTYPHTDTAANPGSAWVEGDYLHWIYTGGYELYSHADYHGDATDHTDSHDDVAHSDVAHGDVEHTDWYQDWYTDEPPIDRTTDRHGDVAHSDSHTDVPHEDDHGDYTDHTDEAYDDRPEEIGV